MGLQALAYMLFLLYISYFFMCICGLQKCTNKHSPIIIIICFICLTSMWEIRLVRVDYIKWIVNVKRSRLMNMRIGYQS